MTFGLECGGDIGCELFQQAEVVAPNLASVGRTHRERISIVVRTGDWKRHNAADAELARTFAPRRERGFTDLRDARLSTPDRSADRSAALRAVIPTDIDAEDIGLRVAGRPDE
jgi:hypothetical protein